MKDVNNDQIRRLRNEDILRRMRQGDPLTSFDSTSSWFPPRPTIAKDPKALQALYGGPKQERRRPGRGFLGELVVIASSKNTNSSKE